MRIAGIPSLMQGLSVTSLMALSSEAFKDAYEVSHLVDARDYMVTEFEQVYRLLLTGRRRCTQVRLNPAPG